MPSDDIEDYDSIEEYIRDQLENGIEITAEDFEGKDCAHCGETIPFTEFPDGVVTWDIRVHDPDEPEPEPYYARYYYCSEECKRENARVAETKSDPDRIHVDDIDDEDLIADGGEEFFEREDSRAAELVSEYLDEHPDGTSNEFEKKASGVAARAEMEYPVNRAPSTVAAASIYLVGLLVNEKLYQHEVSEISGVSEGTIQRAYPEIAEHEGIPVARNQSDEQELAEAPPGLVQRFVNRVIRRD